MAVFDTNRTATTADFRFGVFNAIAKPMANFMTWNDRRVTRKALSALTARELDDIGLCRADINKI